MKKNQLTTTQSTALILGKSKSLMKITKKLLEGKKKELVKKSQDLATHKDITIIDDLMWEKETQEKMNWYGADTYAQNLRLGGYDNWRLPSIEELRYVVRLCGEKDTDSEIYQANCKAKGFVSDAHYWSSTERDSSYRDPCRLAMYFGTTYRRDDSFGVCDSKFYVRCVRGGKPFKRKKSFTSTFVDNYDIKIYEKLRKLRAQIASKKALPEYIVFSDKTLKDMANKIPQNKEDMLEVHGIGEVKFERYGEIFLKALQSS